MEMRALLHDQELLFLTTVIFSYVLRAVESSCITSSVPAFSTRDFNLTSRRAINSSKDCIGNGSKAYQFTLDVPRTVKGLNVANGSIIATTTLYSYNGNQWIDYRGNVTVLSSSRTEFEPPIFLKHLVITLNSSTGGNQCLNVTLNACNEDLTPSVLFQQTGDLVLVDSIDVVCNIHGQPYWDVAWQTANGFVFPSIYIENSFSSLNGSHRSRLKVVKENLSKHGFKCRQNSPPCTTIFCFAMYPGCTQSSNASRDLYVLPAPPEQFYIERVLPMSVVLSWKKPVKDNIMNYTVFEIALKSAAGSTRVNISVEDHKATLFRHVIENLQPCTFYEVEVSAVIYHERSSWIRSNFTTTAGLIAIYLTVQNVTADAILASWRTEERFRDNCTAHNASSFLISYRCIQGLSYLNSCRQWQQVNFSSEVRQHAIEDLNPATVYQVVVAGLMDKKGFNVTSNVANFTSKESPPVTGPAYLRFSIVNESAVNISWGEIIREQQNGKILYYRLRVNWKNGLFLIRNHSARDLTAYVVAGLKVCINYDVYVSGCNSAGCSPEVHILARTWRDASEVSFSLVVRLVENSPYNISALVTTSGNISLGVCAASYVMQYREMTTGNWTETGKYDFHRTATVHGLKHFTTYLFRARLIVHSSVGNWTDATKITSDDGIPGTVRNLHVTGLSIDAIEVAWEWPSQPNGVIAGFIVEVHGTRRYNAGFHELIYMNVSNGTRLEARKLSPATFYNISVRASNRKHDGPASSVAYETDALSPLQPHPLIIDQATSIRSNVLVTAKAVQSVNGPVTGYQIIVEQRGRIGQSINFSAIIPNYQEARSGNLSFYLAKIVEPFSGIKNFYIGGENDPLNQRRNYTVYVRTVTEWKGKILFSRPSSTYLNRYPIDERPVISKEQQTSSSLTVKLVPMDNRAQYIRIIIRAVMQNGAVNMPHPDRYADSNITVYSVSKRHHLALPYVTAELGKAYLESSETFIIGDGKQTNRSVGRKRRSSSRPPSSTFFNGPLEPGSSYVLFFRAYHTDNVYFSSDWSIPTSTESLTAKQEAPKGTSAGLIVGLVICIVAVPFFILIGYLLWKRNKKAFEANYRFSTMELVKNSRNSHTLTFSDDVFDPDNSCGSNDNAPAYELKYEVDTSHEGISASNFSAYFDGMKEKENAFEDEFDEIDDRSSVQQCEARDKANIFLNRDPEAIPFDDARVSIQRRMKEATDYINAAFADSYTVQDAYIATQIPTKETTEDFWSMVLQQNIRTIIMLTHVLGDGRVNSPDYWPTSSVKFTFGNGDVVVECRDNVVDDCASVRSFIVGGNNKVSRIVRLFHFNKWPERGVPSSITNLLSFRDVVNKWHKGKNGPKVVNCRNGSGITGTYIALDAVLNNIYLSKIVDVFNYVNYLRTRRTKMVETCKQYQFIFEAVNEFLNKVDLNTQMTNRNARELYQSLITVDPLTGHTGIQKIFKNLSRGLESEFSTVKEREGSRAVNEYKNRYSFKIPHDEFRVKLQDERDVKPYFSDYINATFISISTSSRFITTQAPFGITINDFWTMVHLHKAEVIVSLNCLEECTVSFTQYWPGNDAPSVIYGSIKVSCEQETTPFPCVVQRDFTLSEASNPSRTTEVTQFHVLGWEDHDIPSSRTAILQLCHHLINDWMSEETPPLIIQCSDGFGRSGTFCICLEAMKQLKNEGIADIQQIARAFKEKNRYFVENEAQFKFIYDVGLDFASKR